MDITLAGSYRRLVFGVAIALSLLVTSPLTCACSASDGPRWTSVKSHKVSPQNDKLLKRVEKAIEISKRRILSGDVHTPWQIMHGLLALRKGFEIRVDKKMVNAWDWIKTNPKFEGEHWFQKTRNGGRAHPYNKPYAFEGHPNQFLAIMAVADIPIDAKIQTPKGAISLKDIVKNAQATVSAEEECAWTLWGLTHYIGSEAQWENKYGERWSIEKLAQVELDQNFYEAACGGTHAIFGLSYALNRHRKSGKRLRGVWLEVDQKVKKFIQLAKSNQNDDGSFSDDYFRSKKYTSDFETRLSSSGHVLEFLMVSLPNKRLKEKWVRRGVEAMARDLIQFSDQSAECSALYHALDSMVMYRERIQTQIVARKLASQQKIARERQLPQKHLRAEKPKLAQKTLLKKREVLPPVVAPRPIAGHRITRSSTKSVTIIAIEKAKVKREDSP